MASDQPTAVEWISGDASEGSLELVHQALARIWLRVLPPADDLFRMLFDMAVAEVAANILEHARPEGRSIRMDLELSVWPDRVEARFSDDGQPLARRIEARGLGLDEPPRERGRGLGLALSALDELGYESVDGLNRWRLVKHRARAPEGSLQTT
jgi:serine/threonine-protein kinase RsbW